MLKIPKPGNTYILKTPMTQKVPPVDIIYKTRQTGHPLLTGDYSQGPLEVTIPAGSSFVLKKLTMDASLVEYYVVFNHPSLKGLKYKTTSNFPIRFFRSIKDIETGILYKAE